MSLNYFVDPYRLFVPQAFSGWVNKKPHFEKFLEQAKLREVSRNNYDWIILGNSRADRGLDPAGICNGQISGYNMALPGSNLEAISKLMDHVIHNTDTQNVVLDLDYAMTFLIFQDRFSEVTSGRNLMNTSAQNFLSAAVFSSQALVDSLDTIFNQSERSLKYKPNGTAFMDLSQPVQYKTVFANGRANLTQSIVDGTNYGQALAEQMLVFQRLLSKAQQHNLKLELIISPTHLELENFLRQKRLWSWYQSWKSDLYKLNTSVAEQSGKRAFTIYDFSEVDEYRLEPVPELGRMRWNQNLTHYSQELGSLMLAKINACDSKLEQASLD